MSPDSSKLSLSVSRAYETNRKALRDNELRRMMEHAADADDKDRLDVLNLLLTADAEIDLEELAMSPSIPLYVYDLLIDSGSIKVRSQLARNKSLPTSILFKLADKDNSTHALLLARHANSDAKVLQLTFEHFKLWDDSSDKDNRNVESVKALFYGAILSHPAATSELRQEVVNSHFNHIGHNQIREMIIDDDIKHKVIGPEVSHWIQKAFLENERIPKDWLLEITTNPKVEPEVLFLAINQGASSRNILDTEDLDLLWSIHYSEENLKLYGPGLLTVFSEKQQSSITILKEIASNMTTYDEKSILWANIPDWSNYLGRTNLRVLDSYNTLKEKLVFDILTHSNKTKEIVSSLVNSGVMVFDNVKTSALCDLIVGDEFVSIEDLAPHLLSDVGNQGLRMALLKNEDKLEEFLLYLDKKEEYNGVLKDVPLSWLLNILGWK